MFETNPTDRLMSYTIYMRNVIRAIVLFSFPLLSFAQATSTAPTGGLQLFFKNLLDFINTTLIPFILGIGFLFFVFNAFRYFILQGDTDDGREKAKSLAIYSVLAFVIVVIFWGIVNLLTSSTGLAGKTAPEFDYVKETKKAAPAN